MAVKEYPIPIQLHNDDVQNWQCAEIHGGTEK